MAVERRTIGSKYTFYECAKGAAHRALIKQARAFRERCYAP